MVRYDCSYDTAADILLGMELARLDAISALRITDLHRRDRYAQELADRHGWLAGHERWRAQASAEFHQEWDDDDVNVDWDRVLRIGRNLEGEDLEED